MTKEEIMVNRIVKLGEEYQRAVVKWFRKDKNFGFLLIPDQPDLFMHFGDGGIFEKIDDEIGVYTFACSPSRIPREGDEIIYMEGSDKQGRPKAKRWGLAEDFDKFNSALQLRLREEEEERRFSPVFRCMECRRSFGSKDVVKTIFNGTKWMFEQRYPLGAYNKFDRLDPLLTEINGDTEYIRWFERQTDHAWIKCKDPRKTKLHVTVSQAAEILWACNRSVNQEKWEVSWHARRGNHELIALGRSAGDKRTIKFVESPNRLETTFESGESRFETLWTAGHNVPSLTNSVG